MFKKGDKVIIIKDITGKYGNFINDSCVVVSIIGGNYPIRVMHPRGIEINWKEEEIRLDKENTVKRLLDKIDEI